MITPSTLSRVRNAATGRRLLLGGVAALSLVLAACSSSPSSSTTTTTSGSSTTTPNDPYAAADLKAPANTLTGAGSTFDQPFFTKAFYVYNKEFRGDRQLRLDRQRWRHPAVPGQYRELRRLDVPMSPVDISRRPGGQVLQVPVALGGVAISYNVPGVAEA